jgi:hypothetical protein
VRWELLFEDLEALAEAGEREAFEADVGDRGRAERSGLRLIDRLHAHLDGVVTCQLTGGERLTGRLVDIGADWALMDDGTGPVLVPLAAVTGVEGLSRRAGVTSELMRRTRLTTALRRLARDRSTVHLRLTDGGQVTGTIDRVGADHLDVALHAPDEPRRPRLVRGVRVVPVPALACVRVVF